MPDVESMAAAAGYNDSHLILQTGANPAASTGAGMATLVPAPDTSSWYGRQYGCLKSDPTAVARLHSFPDGPIPEGVPNDPAAASRICLDYRTAWPMEDIDAGAMVDAERMHPQFAFSAGGPGTVYQIDVESQLRRLDQPLGRCQAVLAADAPLYRNTVAPPPPAPGTVPAGVLNASNPVAAIVRPGRGADACRAAADAVAMSMSGRWLNNPTRYDTMQFALPFAPPGIGSASRVGR